jgi:hypothetical protein
VTPQLDGGEHEEQGEDGNQEQTGHSTQQEATWLQAIEDVRDS